LLQSRRRPEFIAEFHDNPASAVLWSEMKKLIASALLTLAVTAHGGPNPPPAAAPAAPPRGAPGPQARLTPSPPLLPPGAPARDYAETSAKAVRKIQSELYQTLDEKYQKLVSPDAVRLESLDAPVIAPIPGGDETRRLNQVFVSEGYIALLNHVAHAKAIDRIQPGYFAQYVLNLARDTGSGAPSGPPEIVDSRYWSDEVMNDQISYFNQMLSLTMAINLSHHYLGHYTKYADRMMAGKLVPINSLLTPEEWDASVRAASLNSFDAGCFSPGAQALFEAIDKMPERPAWTAFIVPQGVNLKKLNEDLAKYEALYFRGGLK
jgi:hypothetical protein